MKRTTLVLILLGVIGILLFGFFYVSAPNGDEYGLTKHYMGLPPCEIAVGDELTHIGPPKGFKACRFYGMVGVEKIPEHAQILITDVEGPPMRLGTLGPGESKKIRLFGEP